MNFKIDKGFETGTSLFASLSKTLLTNCFIKAEDFYQHPLLM